jgi:hypothetical protein
MTPFGLYVGIDPQADRVLQLIIAAGPLLLVFMMRLVLGRSKEVALAVWVSIGWFAFRASLNPSMAAMFRPIERLLVG